MHPRRPRPSGLPVPGVLPATSLLAETATPCVDAGATPGCPPLPAIWLALPLNEFEFSTSDPSSISKLSTVSMTDIIPALCGTHAHRSMSSNSHHEIKPLCPEQLTARLAWNFRGIPQ